MSEKNLIKQDDQPVPAQESVLKRALMTGFVGGLFWSMLWVITYYFSFSEIAPKSYLLRSWLHADWTDNVLGDVISILLTGIISVVIAFLYYVLIKKAISYLAGIMYGIVLWAILFYLLQPIFPNIPSLLELDKDTIITTLCLFIAYGTFIGYSISYDYHEYQNK